MVDQVVNDALPSIFPYGVSAREAVAQPAVREIVAAMTATYGMDEDREGLLALVRKRLGAAGVLALKELEGAKVVAARARVAELGARLERLKPKPAVEPAPKAGSLKGQFLEITRNGAVAAAEVLAAESVKPKPAEEPKARVQLPAVVPVGWEVRQQRRGNEIEELTRVPGVVGEIVEWIVRGARRPNRVMALGVATVVVGTLVGRLIEGPTGSATHLFVIILAPTGYGKDWPLQCGGKVMEAVGAADLLGPHEFASAPGFLKRLKRNPLMVSFIDELGDELSLINSQGANDWVSKIIGTLKKCYNAWGTVITAEKVHEESERIEWPAPSIVGAGTPESFFDALRPQDLASGFANRLLILPFEGCQRPAEQDPADGSEEPPKKLVGKLKKLPRQGSIGQPILEKPNLADILTQPVPQMRRQSIDWGAGAREVYFAFSRKMDGFEDGDRRRYELGMRACENAVRLATIVAVGRGSAVVDREDIEWGIAVAERSFEAAVGGVEKYMREYFDFPKFCERVLEKLAQAGGWRSRRDLERDFRSNKRWGFELGKALAQLEAEERIEAEWCASARGPASMGYRLIEEGNLSGNMALGGGG